MALLVTGANGHLGRRVVELLLARNPGPIVAGTRNPAQLADFAARGVTVRKLDFDDEPAVLAEAFRGVDRALIISTDKLDATDARLRQHERAVAAAAQAGVRHVLYTSMPHPDADSPVPFAYQHRGTEEAIQRSGLSWTILRNNWYSDFLVLMGRLPQAIASGTYYASTGEGGAALVTREDCAQAAAAALAATDFTNRIYNITGPDAVTGADLAAIATDVSGKPVTFISIPPDALKQAMLSHGVPAPIADALVGSDLATQLGQFGPATDDVLTLTGQRPTSVRAVVERHKDALLTSRPASAAH